MSKALVLRSKKQGKFIQRILRSANCEDHIFLQINNEGIFVETIKYHQFQYRKVCDNYNKYKYIVKYKIGDCYLRTSGSHVWSYRCVDKFEGCCLLVAALWDQRSLRIDNPYMDRRDELPFEWLKNVHRKFFNGYIYTWDEELLGYPLLL